MTKEEFEVLQLNLQQSGKSVKDYLREAGVNYSTYNYWRKKSLAKDNPKPELAPISFTQHADPVFSSSIPSGATLLFPNGLRAHFGSGTEDVLRELTRNYTNEEIAQRLNISVNTVRTHIQHMLEKTGYRNRIDLAVNAKALGLVVHEEDRKENRTRKEENRY